jgi:protein arginine kinase activator
MNKILVCVQCGFTHAEFLARGLLGCPECYNCFGDALWDDLLHVHPALYRRPPVQQEAKPLSEDSGVLREKLANALRYERYEEAAELRRRLHELSAAAGGTA